MIRANFLAQLDTLARALAAAARGIARASGLPADHMLEAITAQARVYLMRWERKPRNMGPPRAPPKMRARTPPTTL